MEINAILFCPCVQTGQNVGIISKVDIQIKVVPVFVTFPLRNTKEWVCLLLDLSFPMLCLTDLPQKKYRTLSIVSVI